MADPFSQFPIVASAAPTRESADPFAAFPKVQQPSGIDYSRPVPEVRAAIAKLPADRREQALREWADTFVANERKGAGIGQGVSDAVRNFSRGTPVGSWLDEANAALAAGQHAIGLGGAPYEEALAYQRAKDRAIDTESTKLGTLPVIGDVTTGGLTKFAGGVASAPFSPAVRAVQGGSMLGNMTNAGITGAGYGALYGAGEGETVDERAKSAGMGGAVGLGVGVAAPVVARGVSNAASYVSDKFRPPPQTLRPYDRQAVRNISQGATDDALFPQRYQRAAAELGPEGMLADMGPNMRSQAGAIANRPGPGQRILTDRLEARRTGDPQSGLPSAADRITADVNAGLGPAVNVPETTRQLRQQANAAANPYYEQFYNTPIKPTPELEAILRRVPKSAWHEAQRLAEMEGVDLANVMNTGRGLDLIKRAVDDMARTAERGTNLERLTTNIARDLRTETDRILSPSNPAASPWARARELSGEGLQFREAAQMGQGAFQRRLAPDQMAEDMRTMNPLQQEAYRVGARDAVRTNMGNASTAFGPNADTAARKQLQSEFAREKLDMIAKPGGADRINRRLAAETEFADTEQQVLRNSATARRLAAQDLYPKPDSTKDVARSWRQSSAAGLVSEGVFRIANILTSGSSAARAERTARDAALLLTAQGPSRESLAQALMDYGRQQAVSQNQRTAIERIARALMEGSRQQAVEAATNQPH